MIVEIRVKIDGKLPFKATPGSAGYDLFSTVDINIPPMERKVILTGVYMEMPDGYEAQIRSRSGLAANHGIIVLNAPGTIDSDYRNEVKVILYNTSQVEFQVTKDMRIAQMVFAEVAKTTLIPIDALSETDRKGGFGSTGA